ncbi:MAG: hypothetical protein WA979_12495 [Pacificimonas sp.]
MAFAAVSTLVACEGEPDVPSRYRDIGIPVADVPPAYRVPLAAMNAIGRGGMIEKLETCEGFSLTENGLPLDLASLGDFRRMVYRRLGERAGVATDISAYDSGASRVTILSRSIAGDEAELESEWTLRLDGEALDCVSAVDLREAAA